MINSCDNLFLFSLKPRDFCEICSKINLQPTSIDQYTLLTQYFLAAMHQQKPHRIEAYLNVYCNYWMTRRCTPPTSQQSYLEERRKADVIFLKLGGMVTKHYQEALRVCPQKAACWKEQIKHLGNLLPSDLTVKESDLFEALNTFPIYVDP